MALLHYLWSKVAASNATADSNVNWAEGQAPSSVNDSARNMMASLAGFRDDIAGAIATGGTSTAYTVTSNQVFDTLAHMSGQLIAFTPHTTNGATVTLNVDGLGAKPLRSAPSTELLAGVLVQGTPYVALYNNSDAVWYLQNFFVNPFQVPLGGIIDFAGSSVPSTAFAFPVGQAISRSGSFAPLFSLIGTTYGSGDGSTTFNLPDYRGRVAAGKDNMGGTTASRLTSTTMTPDGNTLGATNSVGGQTVTLGAGDIPTLTSTGSASLSASVTSTNWVASNSNDSSGNAVSGGGSGLAVTGGTFGSVSKIASTGTASGSISTSYTNNSQTSVPNVQPTILVNKLIRII